MTRAPFLSQQMQKALVCLFFAGALLLGLLTVGDYGRPWDESDEMDILRANLWEYAQRLGWNEAPFEAWAGEQRETISPLRPIGESIERDHGVAAFYPLAGAVMSRSLPEHTRMLIWHGGCWALWVLGMYALYACCRQLGMCRGWGLLAALWLLLSPRFFAEGHYNNKDVALLALALCVLWQGLRLMARPSFPRALGFALAGALAANTKVVGFALWGLCGLFVLARCGAARRLNRHTLWVGGAALIGFFAFYALLTPALWRDPLGFAGYLVNNALAFTRWENYVRFRGTTYLLANQRLPWYYLPYMIVATTPLWLLLLLALGGLLGGRKLWRCRKALFSSDRAAGLTLTGLLWLLPLGFAVVTRTTVYNGWRHFYFIYGFLVLTAVWGAQAFWNGFLQNKALPRRLFGGLLALAMGLTGTGIATQHPFQYVYYQPVVRLLTRAEDLELDYWNVSVMNALEALAAQNAEGQPLTVGYADLWAEAGLRRTLPALPEPLQGRFLLVDEPEQAEYVLANPTYALFSGFAPTPGMEEAVCLEAYGRPIMRVYRNGEAREDAAQGGAAQQATGQDDAARDDTAQQATARDETAQDGVAQQVTAQDGVAQQVTAQDSAARDGTAQGDALTAAAPREGKP